MYCCTIGSLCFGNLEVGTGWALEAQNQLIRKRTKVIVNGSVIAPVNALPFFWIECAVNRIECEANRRNGAW